MPRNPKQVAHEASPLDCVRVWYSFPSPPILLFFNLLFQTCIEKEWSLSKINHQMCPRRLWYLHYTFSAEKDLQLRSKSEALPRAFSHRSGGGGGGIWRSGPAPSGRPLARATACWRDGEAAEQQVHGGKQGLEEADGAEGGAPMGGEVYLVGVWAGGDEGWLELVWSATGREKEG